METKCLNCGKVLTAANGRAEATVVDSSLPSKSPDGDTTWLRCKNCHSAALLARIAPAGARISMSLGAVPGKLGSS